MPHVNWQIRALTVPGPDTDLSLYVAFDNVRYLFGCGEGTQRAFVQKALSMRGLTGVFLPDGGSKGRAGLPGVIMTASDAGIRKLDVIGPSDTTQFLGTLRASVYRQEFGIQTYPYTEGSTSEATQTEEEQANVYTGASLTVKSYTLRPQTSSSTQHVNAESGPSRLTSTEAESLARKHVHNMFPSGRPSRPDLYSQPFQPVPTYDQTATQMVYICQAPTIPGKFDADRAKQLRVPNGSIRAKLVQGQEIEFDDPDNPGQKKVVKPEEVVGDTVKGAYLAMVNCTTETLPDLLQSTAFTPFLVAEDGQSPEQLAVMIHRAPTAVWQDERYQTWMKTFGDATRHFIATTDNYRNDATFNTSAWNVLNLSLLDGDIFPLLVASTPTPLDKSNSPPNTEFLVPNHYRSMQPPKETTILDPHERDTPYPTTLEEVQSARRDLLRKQPDFAVQCQMAREAVRRDPRWDQPSSEVGDGIMITTLGTGSAIPSKYRNVSSTLLDIPNLGGILLDCGEGTLGQMRRKYGEKGIKKVYENLRMIFVSHMHADHHLGLQAILEDRFKNGVDSKLYLVAPSSIAISMCEAGPWSHGVSPEALENLVWIDNSALLTTHLPGVRVREGDDGPTNGVEQDRGEFMVDPSYANGSRRWPKYDVFGEDSLRYAQHGYRQLMSDLGLSGIRAPKVAHRGHAWGLVLQHQSGWKIVYSGDTKPSGNLIHAGRNATLLIHEATLEDDKPETAAEKGHSTFSQAIQVGRDMRARHILLNHFSQRYPKIPKSRVDTTPGQEGGEVVSISYDFMSVKIGQMWRMKYYMDAAELLFASEQSEEEEAGVVKADIAPGEGKAGQGKDVKGKNKSKGKEGKRGASPNGKQGRVEYKKSRSEESR